MSSWSQRLLLATAPVAIAVGLFLLAPPLGAHEIKTEKTIHFLGFSENQGKAAWSIHIQRYGRKGSRTFIDRYAVIRVVKAIDNATFASYKVGEIERTNLRGKKIPAKSAELNEQNPFWHQASPSDHWRVMLKGFQFGAARLTASTAVTTVPDPDVELTTRPGNNGILEIKTKTNNLGYTLAMATGEKAHLGRYRHDVEVDQRARAQLEIYISVKGDFAAVLNRFETIGADEDEVSAVTYGKVVPITVTGATGGNFIWVRMSWGWKKMTPYQERVYRESRTQRLKFAQMMLGIANGNY